MQNPNFESPVKPEGAMHQAAPSSEHLMPSNQDFQKSLAAGKDRIEPRCDLPDFIIEGHGESRTMEPTAKRREYDGLAREALNGAAPADGQPPSAKEQDIARQVAELSLKAQADLPKSTENMDRTNDIQKLHDIFEKLSPESAQRVINEANKTLEGQNQRIAQSAVGEIWLGTRPSADKPFYLSAELKEINCAPSV